MSFTDLVKDETTGRVAKGRVAAVVGAAGFLLCLVIVTVALIIGPPTEEPAATSGTSTNSDRAPSTSDDDEEAAADDDVIGEVIFDDIGMVEMPVTTNPREAAAGAVQVMLSAQPTKIPFLEDFRDEALTRVMYPSPDFVGPKDYFRFKGQNFTTEYDFTGAETQEQMYESHRERQYRLDKPNGKSWWFLNHESSWQSYASWDMEIVSEPTEVLNEAETRELVSDAAWFETALEEAEDVNLPDGATFENYWVRVETAVKEVGPNGEVMTLTRYPAGVSIYCDPPTEGGLCGMVSTLTRFPSEWKVAEE